MSESFVQVGKIHSAQGVRGDLFVWIFAEEADWVAQWNTLWLGPAEQKQPTIQRKIIKKRPHQKQKKWGYSITIEGVADRDQAELLVGQGVFVPDSFFVTQEGDSIYLREILGFLVEDKNRGPVGHVVGFTGSDLQDRVIIEDPQGKTFEVPLVKPLWVDTDKAIQKIIMDIPIGLLPGEEL